MKKLQNNFNAGELSPLLSARTDIDKYASGCSELKNMFVLPQGGVTRRSGTIQITNNLFSNTSNLENHLIPFVFSENISYLLEFTGLEVIIRDNTGNYINVTNSALTISAPISQNVYSYTNLTWVANVYQTYTGEALQGYVTITTDYTGTVTNIDISEGAGFIQQLDPLQSNCVAIIDDIFGLTDLKVFFNITSTGNGKYRIRHKFTITDWSQLQYVQSADVIFFSTGVDYPYKLSRYRNTDWRFERMNIINPPFELFNDNKYLQLNLDVPNQWASGINYEINDCISVILSTSTYNIVNGSIAEVGRKLIKNTDSNINKSFYKEVDDINTTRIKVSLPNGVTLKSGDYIDIQGAVGTYSGIHKIVLLSFETNTNVIQIDVPYTVFTFGVGSIKKNNYVFFKCINNHTANASHLNPSLGNTDDWEEITTNFTGKNYVISGKGTENITTGDLVKIRFPKINNSIDNTSTIKTISVKGRWNLTTHGTWTGKLKLQRSFDNGITWENYREYSSNADQNFIVGDLTEDTRVLLKILDTGAIAGLTWELYTFEVYDEGEVLITQIKTPFQLMLCNIIKPIASFYSSYLWADNSWGKNYGYPEFISFYLERLIFGANKKHPNTFWMSQINDYENFQTGVLDTDAIEITLSSSRIDKIQWIVGHKDLLIGTIENEWVINSRDTNKVLTPTTIQAKVNTTYGGKNVRAEPINGALLFVQKYGGKIREFAYNYQKDGYQSPELTILSEHILSSGVKEMHLQKTPTQKLWCLLNNGTIAVLEYDRLQNIIAWSRVELSTNDNNNNKFGLILSLTIIPNNGYDYIYMITDRDTDRFTGIGKRLERFLVQNNNTFNISEFTDQQYMYVDNMVQTLDGHVYNADFALTGSNLRYMFRPNGVMENTDLFIIHDDGLININNLVEIIPIGNNQNTNYIFIPDNSATFNWVTSNYVNFVGMPFESRVKPMFLEEVHATSTLKKRAINAELRVFKSGLFNVGQYGKNDEVILKNEDGSVFNNDYGFTGDVIINPPVGYHKQIAFEITTTKPTAMNLLSLTYEYQLYK